MERVTATLCGVFSKFRCFSMLNDRGAPLRDRLDTKCQCIRAEGHTSLHRCECGRMW